MVVIPGKIRVQAAKPKSLEQMSLPQITAIVVDAAAFIPARHRPDVAGRHHKAYETAGNLQIMHRVIPTRGVQVVVAKSKVARKGLAPSLIAKSHRQIPSPSPDAKSYRQVTIGARPSSTSDIRSR